MQTIIDYFQATYTKSQILFFIIFGIVLSICLIVSLVAAIIDTVLRVKRRKLAENTSLAELYLLISDLEDKLKEVDGALKDKGITQEEKAKLVKSRKSLRAEKTKYESRLKAILHTDIGDYTMEEAKQFAEEQVRRKIKKIEKDSEEPLDLPTNDSDDGLPPEEDNLADDETPASVIYDRLTDDEQTEKEGIAENATWVIQSQGGEYLANLRLGDEILLSTMPYTSLSGVKSAIITLRKNLEEENCTVTVDEEENFIFKVFSASGKLLSESEKYNSKPVCETALTRARTYANAQIEEN